MSVLKKPCSKKLWKVSILAKRWWCGQALERAAAADTTETIMSGCCWCCCHIALLVVHHNKCRRRCGHSCQGFRAAAKKKRSKSISKHWAIIILLPFNFYQEVVVVLYSFYGIGYGNDVQEGESFLHMSEWVRCVCVCFVADLRRARNLGRGASFRWGSCTPLLTISTTTINWGKGASAVFTGVSLQAVTKYEGHPFFSSLKSTSP